MSKFDDPREGMRALDAYTSLVPMSEERRQAVGIHGFDEFMGLGGRLSKLVRCERCGLLDVQSPCGDHEEE